MKKILVMSMIAFMTFANAQNTNFEINNDGLTKYVVTEIPNVSKEMAYKKAIDWVNREFDTPDKVIKGNIENEYVRIEGISNKAMRYPAIGGIVHMPIKFEIEISLKDNRYKFEIISLKEKNYSFPAFSTEPFFEVDLSNTKRSDYNPVRKNNGEFRYRYKFVSDLPAYFNELNKSLKEYMMGEYRKNDNW